MPYSTQQKTSYKSYENIYLIYNWAVCPVAENCSEIIKSETTVNLYSYFKLVNNILTSKQYLYYNSVKNTFFFDTDELF